MLQFIPNSSVNHALIAQSVEQLPFKETVAGSNPAERTEGLFSTVITKPSIQTVMKIASGLGVSVDDLMK